jgi:hypothetical protein
MSESRGITALLNVSIHETSRRGLHIILLITELTQNQSYSSISVQSKEPEREARATNMPPFIYLLVHVELFSYAINILIICNLVK